MTSLEKINTIRRSTRDIVQHLGYLNHLFAHIGSISQCYALQKLEAEPLTLFALSDALTLDRSTTSRLAKDLVAKDYCVLLANDKDGRSRYLALTALGHQKLQEIHQVATQQVHLVLESMTQEEQELVVRGLSLYANALKNKPIAGDPNEPKNKAT
jgi:DNA-binding MarR family transcriptional regulator